jgi:hypothetical protein
MEANQSPDREEGSPQGRLLGDEPSPDDRQNEEQGGIGAPQEGGADSADEAAREGG